MLCICIVIIIRSTLIFSVFDHTIADMENKLILQKLKKYSPQKLHHGSEKEIQTP